MCMRTLQAAANLRHGVQLIDGVITKKIDGVMCFEVLIN